MNDVDDMMALAVGARGAWYAAHVLGVAETLESLLVEGGELDPLRELYLAALGHHLCEVEEVSRDVVRTRFGARVDALIYDTTARDGQARLIIVSDLIANISGCADRIDVLGRQWIAGTFLPLAERATTRVTSVEPVGYPRTAARARSRLELAMSRLRTTLDAATARLANSGIDYRARSREVLKSFTGELTAAPDALRRDDERAHREGWLVFRRGAG